MQCLPWLQGHVWIIMSIATPWPDWQTRSRKQLLGTAAISAIWDNERCWGCLRMGLVRPLVRPDWSSRNVKKNLLWPVGISCLRVDLGNPTTKWIPNQCCQCYDRAVTFTLISLQSVLVTFKYMELELDCLILMFQHSQPISSSIVVRCCKMGNKGI